MNERPSPQLHRALGFWALLAYGVGDILGAGIYALVGEVAGRAGSAAWLSFLVTVAIASLTALSYAELGSRFPRAGGEAQFCERAFRWPSVALLIGFLVFASGMVSLATVSRAFAGYLLEPFLQASWQVEWVAVIAFLLVLTGINIWGIRQSSVVNIVCTLVEAAGLLLVIVVGFAFLAREETVPAVEPAKSTWTWMAIMQGSALAFFAFIGFEDMVNVAEEVKQPKRNLPLAILLALTIAGTIYVIVAWIATRVVPPSELLASDAPLLEVIRRAAPIVPAWLFTLIALFAVANTGLLNYVMTSRLLYGMAGQGLLPHWLHAVHPRTQTPHRAILLILAAVLGLALSGTLVHLAGTTNVLLLAVFISVNLSLIVLKLRGETATGGFHVPLPVPIGGAASCLMLIFFVPRASLLLALAIVATGLVVVALWSWRSRSVAASKSADST